jgi:hypothetical protein
MTRELLMKVLDDFSVLMEEWFDLGPQPGEEGYNANYPYYIRLVVHGGACMLLHPGLHALSEQQAAVFARTQGSYTNEDQNKHMGQRRTTTRDVDFIARGFILEYGSVLVDKPSVSYSNGKGGRKGRRMSAEERLRGCIHETALKRGLGEDWMNADADVALPTTYECVRYSFMYLTTN